MKYYSTIASLLTLSVLTTVSLLYFANVTRSIEKENLALKEQIEYFEDQLNINEIEFNLYNSYDYLKKMQKIYFVQSKNNNLNSRINYFDLQKQNIENFYRIGIKK